jgi:hypothetical protein
MWMHDATSAAQAGSGTHARGNCLAAVVMARWKDSPSVAPAAAPNATHAPTLTRRRAPHVVRGA